MQKIVRGVVVLGALTWSSIAWAVVGETAVSVKNSGAPLAEATVSIKPVARTTPRSVSTAQRPASTPRVAPPRATTKTDDRGTYILRYDDELHRGMLFDVTVTTRGGQSWTLRGLSVGQILAGIDVASPGGTRPASAFPSGSPALPAVSDQRPLCESGYYYIPGTNTCLPIRRDASPAGTEGVMIEVGGNAIARRVTGNVQRIARDSGGTIFYDLGNEKQNGSGAGFNVGVRVPIGTQFFGQKSYVNFGYNYLRVTGDGSGGQASTTSFISFPGLGVGANPNGFFAAGTMPFSYQYDFTQQRHGGEIAAGFEIEQGPVEFYPWAGVRFGSNSVEDTYSVSRPMPVPINATYMTDSNVSSLGIFIGLSVSVQPEGSPIEFFTQGRVGVDSNWAKSDVNFNIVFPGTNETQQVSLSEQKFTPYLFLETGVKVKLGVVQANVSGFVEHGGYAPNISIPGGGASPVLQGETQTNYGGKLSLTARFN